MRAGVKFRVEATDEASMATAPTSASRREDGFGLVEMIVVLVVIAILGAAVVLMMGSTKESSRQKISMTKMQEAKTALQRGRDREQMTLQEVLGGSGSVQGCASLNPMPTVAQLTGSCRTAWDAVNAKLAPYVGSVPAAAQMMTDGAGRPILVEALETGCPAGVVDRLVSVHPSGDRSKPAQELQLDPSGYGC